MNTTLNEFIDWFHSELNNRGMSYSEAADTGGVSRASISMMLAGQSPGKKLCTAIARAFNLPPETVFRKAGILPPAPEHTPELLEVEHLFSVMSKEKRQLLLLQMRAWANGEPEPAAADNTER